MKNAILIHGTGSNPTAFWFPWLREQLEGHGFKVSALQMPNADAPDLNVWTQFAFDNLSFDEETLLIGHSAGCPTTLSILNRLTRPIKRAILVAGFIRLDKMEDDNVMLIDNQNPDWDKIKTNGHEFFFFNSDNDPWGCTHLQGEELRRRLGGTLIVRTGEGHFGSKIFEQPYDTFPMLRDVCLL